MSVHVVPSRRVGRSKLSAILSSALDEPAPRPADRVLEQGFWQRSRSPAVDEERAMGPTVEPLPFEHRSCVVALRRGSRRP